MLSTNYSSMYYLSLFVISLLVSGSNAVPTFVWSDSTLPSSTDGYTCIDVIEPSTPGWGNKYLCSNTYSLSGWSWTYTGSCPQDTSLILWNEESDPNWSDNGLCIPNSDPYTYAFSSSTPGYDSWPVQTLAATTSWNDNWFYVTGYKFTSTPYDFLLGKVQFKLMSSPSLISAVVQVSGTNYPLSTAYEDYRYSDVLSGKLTGAFFTGTTSYTSTRHYICMCHMDNRISRVLGAYESIVTMEYFVRSASVCQAYISYTDEFNPEVSKVYEMLCSLF